ncbi:hypothetical protein [Neorhizobium sp. LjRoot104]|uniref:hypothetical protein n=1 Tax=Neorhizobium sp. LjRoot104 TaxID=3342254 RepID=UPI003ECD40B9
MTRILLILAVALTGFSTARAEDTEVKAWAKEKCVRYERAWSQAKDFIGLDGVGDDFIKGNEKFIADGCSSGADVCPHSPQEIKLANALTMAAMNFGTASSFLPFICRQR